MREAVVPRYRLANSRTSTKVLTSLGMLGLLLGLTSAILLTVYKTGLRAEDVRNYYLGTTNTEGIDTELDEMLAASSPRPFNEMVEVTHLHLLGGSILLFLLCHLLAVCDVKDSIRTTLYLISFLSFLTTFSLPWLIIYVSPFWSVFFGSSVITFSVSLVILCLIPLKEMWLSL